MIIPKFIGKGDRIGIVAPARKISKEEMQNAIDYFQSWGYEVVLGKHLFSVENQYAGSDKERALDFQQMIDDTSVKAIVCARGGYGCLRIADMINYSNYIKNPKWIVGYSDITVFHLISNLKYNIASLHATMPINFPSIDTPNDSVSYLKNIIEGKAVEYKLPNNPYNRKGLIEGEIVGGNLSVLYSMQGSFDVKLLKDKVLFIEDLDEYLYHIDRMIVSLKRGMWFENIKGLVVGGMSDMRDNNIPFGKTCYEIISEAVAEYDFPVCFDFFAGHIRNNLPIILGNCFRLNVE